jgi:hypothetical protein
MLYMHTKYCNIIIFGFTVQDGATRFFETKADKGAHT